MAKTQPSSESLNLHVTAPNNFRKESLKLENYGRGLFFYRPYTDQHQDDPCLSFQLMDSNAYGSESQKHFQFAANVTDPPIPSKPLASNIYGSQHNEPLSLKKRKSMTDNSLPQNTTDRVISSSIPPRIYSYYTFIEQRLRKKKQLGINKVRLGVISKPCQKRALAKVSDVSICHGDCVSLFNHYRAQHNNALLLSTNRMRQALSEKISQITGVQLPPLVLKKRENWKVSISCTKSHESFNCLSKLAFQCPRTQKFSFIDEFNAGEVGYTESKFECNDILDPSEATHSVLPWSAMWSIISTQSYSTNFYDEPLLKNRIHSVPSMPSVKYMYADERSLLYVYGTGLLDNVQLWIGYRKCEVLRE
ncbi:CBF1/Su(H)/LAG-1 family transcription factor Cbf12 [Schizosaccharomyces cryophilus OY26]|uniref:CBF1/Su(H)/LAG-1 family transcription factor Cbf12 n=1 Tax=Schizosaccharomyces cryophilus (strain OY26 / ATCC MYA-4695 / CBS 11777 / NBRC 106824 / NRRL Y48691) TaxID=653667 RepID=S9X4X2_SCHCR|nr:CBF1/Su(H)/LAG-1 family transcription factor Cbf12 [Schizosaccharomyces cryophilus OY26]EPY52132.1 CBF1/Su(H)/LAG-1 family transcription factor Cbf12 [Schizosaccharomyces cryophilus OY26]